MYGGCCCRSSDDQVHFQDILKANSEELLHLDTFAVRNLILTAPRSMRVLSSMQVCMLDHCCSPRLLTQCVASHADVSHVHWGCTCKCRVKAVCLHFAKRTRHAIYCSIVPAPLTSHLLLLGAPFAADHP